MALASMVSATCRAAAEMVLIRLCYVADLPPPGELVRRLQDGQGFQGAQGPQHTGSQHPGPRHQATQPQGVHHAAAPAPAVSLLTRSAR